MSLHPLDDNLLKRLFKTSPLDSMRVVTREGTRIEFKESYNHAGMAQYFKTIASFANHKGGYIVYGISDKPRRLIGLKDNNLAQFEELKVEEFTNNLTDYFSPTITWEHCTFYFNDMCFGIIYTYPLKNKPCICKKQYNSKDPKYTLKEGDIYYRYGGRSERIHYEELYSIINEARKTEEKQWIDLITQTARIGIDNACLLDLNSGIASGKAGSLLIGEELLAKMAFIKEGEFVEKKGTPTLRLIGEIEKIESSKMIVKESVRKVVKAIEADDIVRAFFQNATVEDPLEYIQAICSTSSAYYPVYYFINQSKATIQNVTEMISKKISRGQSKIRLLKRLEGDMIPQASMKNTGTEAYRNKEKYRGEWINESVTIIEGELRHCLIALMSLEQESIKKHESYIRRMLYSIYETYYENVDSNIAGEIRKAICRLDEALFLPEQQ